MKSPVFSPKEVSETRRPIRQAHWLPQRAYVDQEIYQAEKTAIFGREWMGVFHHSSIPNVGDYRSMDIAGRPLLFVRDSSRRIRCYINICRHRGMAVAQGEGNCKGFVCPYHTWVYDLEGKVIRRPLMDENAVGNDDIRLTEVRAELLLGFVFINFDPRAAPVASQYPNLARELGAWGGEDLEVAFERTYPCKWNWKIMFENGMEAYHVAGVHGNSAEQDIPTRLAYVTAPDHKEFTIMNMPYAKDRVYKPHDVMDNIATIPNLPSWVDEEVRFYILWAGTTFYSRKDALIGYFVLPGQTIDDCKVVSMFAVPKEAKENPGFEAYKKAWIELIDLIQVEDESPCLRIQRSYEGCEEWIPGPYADAEGTCWHFHQWYLERLTS